MNTYETHFPLTVQGKTYRIARLGNLEKKGLPIGRLPYTLRILLENLLRLEDGTTVTARDIEALAKWNAKKVGEKEISFMPARVLMQDFTGVPAVVDLAAMRDAMKKMGGDPSKINPLQPAELVIDHSVQIDAFGTPDAITINAAKEFARNHERYAFLRWGQEAFRNFKVVPPDTGIVHQVNLEYLARVVMTSPSPQPSPQGGEGILWAYPDTLFGTDSHTTMVNGLGVLGWGVGGIEAEAAMLGQSSSMLIPEVIGFRLRGSLPEGTTATDAVLTVTQMLRKRGVVGKFVEFFGTGAASLSLADRATIANMAPEYGATCGFFPVDAESIRYLKLTGRSEEQIALIEAYLKEQGLFWTEKNPEPEYTDILDLDLSTVQSCLAGPKRPQDRISLSDVKKDFLAKLPEMKPKTRMTEHRLDQASPGQSSAGNDLPEDKQMRGTGGERLSPPVTDGSVVIASITSCTNTSNPSVLIAAGLLAKKASERGLQSKPWVKTSLAPGSQVVQDYLTEAGLISSLEKLKFHIVGYGCATCIGNSGPLPAPVSAAIHEGGLVAASVLSGNRNFEGRINPDVRANYLASPPLVVAYALAGRIDIDLTKEPLGNDSNGKPVYLKDVWPTNKEVSDAVLKAVQSKMFRKRYGNVYAGDANWQGLRVPAGDTYAWEGDSTYVRNPPYFDGMSKKPSAVSDITGARVLAVLGDSVTTDHISPAGSIKKDGPAGRYLIEQGVKPEDFNSFGSRRGNHEVMMRGTFANIRLKNKLVPGIEGGVTVYLSTPLPAARHSPTLVEKARAADAQMSIYDASMKYQAEKVPLVILAGKEYGSGSSRDWAAKGPALQGIRAVIAESYERIHRSNLVGMGILPLQFLAGDSIEKLGLTGREVLEIVGLAEGVKTQFKLGRELIVRAKGDGGKTVEFKAKVRIDTPQEIEYYRHGGILQYVLRKLLAT